MDAVNVKTAILHYSAPPIVGGVETVIRAHAREFVRAGLPLTIIAGRGEAAALPEGVEFIRLPEVDSQHPDILLATGQLNAGKLPENFDELTNRLFEVLRPLAARFDRMIVHNIFTKHFNLPLTAALFKLLDEDTLHGTIAWCHDLTWTSPHSRSLVYDAYPWTLLKTPHQRVTYVAVSQLRAREISKSFNLPLEQIPVIYDGVDPDALLGLSAEGSALIARLGLYQADLVLLMPVRVTQAKNIEFGLVLTRALKDRGRLVKLVLTGPPDPHDQASIGYYNELRDMRSRLGVESEMRFVYESGPDPDQPHTIAEDVVAQLYRAADVVLLPSHREGFGMPVLEAGLAGAAVVTTGVPAAVEIGGEDVLTFEPASSPEQLADRILTWARDNPQQRLRSRVRASFTWQAIFQRDILPLLEAHSR